MGEAMPHHQPLEGKVVAVIGASRGIGASAARALAQAGASVAVGFHAAQGGSIVNMASTAGLQGARGLSDYSAAKHGVIGASKSVALEFAPQRVRVNVVAPGPILNDRIAALTEEQRAPIVRAVPLGRIGRPEDVAAAVVWLCSDESSFVTGAVLPVDGGRLAGFFGGG
jgi:NAD(P)-dependent dehydrogenase (short-subunit alcohol dehydrogenase family)